jgi:hypothetical protein
MHIDPDRKVHVEKKYWSLPRTRYNVGVLVFHTITHVETKQVWEGSSETESLDPWGG